MAKFTDQCEREWEIKFNVRILESVEEKFKGLDLTAAHGKDFLRLAYKPALLVDLLWHLLEKQAQAKDLDVEQFVEGFVGQGIADATQCLLKAVTDFLHPSQAEVVAACANASKAEREEAAAMVLAKIKDPETLARFREVNEQKMNAEIEKILTQSIAATDTQDFSE